MRVTSIMELGGPFQASPFTRTHVDLDRVGVGGPSLPVFFFSGNFVKFQTWKIWFRPIQRIFHGKMTQIRQISKIYFFKYSNFYNKLQKVAKSIEGFWFFSAFISRMLPNLAKLSYGWLPHQLHHKIGKKKKTWSHLCGFQQAPGRSQ